MTVRLDIQAGKYLSKTRLYKYAIINKDNQLKAYEDNLAVSEKIISMISFFEVIFRNKINMVLVSKFGADYLRNKNRGKIFDKTEQRMIDSAYNKSEKESIKILESKVLTELTLGFWCMIAKKYSLWTECLHKIHPNKKGVKFKIFKRQITLIADIRNKIAHHERIVKKRPYSMQFILSIITEQTLLLIDENDDEFKEHVKSYMDSSSQMIQRLIG